MRDFALIGRKFVQQSTASSTIKYDPTYHRYAEDVSPPTENPGYDGQFYYFIALDPVNARYYMDNDPSYRYTRILYPMTARLLALGQPDLIPYTLVITNWLAIGGGTLAVAAWLKRKGVSPWFALAYGLYPGLFMSLQRDLTEALSYALVALAVYLFDFGGRWRVVWAGIGFALAVLARETAVVFPVFYTLALLLERSGGSNLQERLLANWRQASLLGGLALLPMISYKVFLFTWLGMWGPNATQVFEAVPFAGVLYYYWSWQEETRIQQMLTIVLPALICMGASLRALWGRIYSVEVWVLLAQVLLFVVFLGHAIAGDFFALGRVTIGVVLAATFCLPIYERLKNTSRLWFWTSSVLWLAPVPFSLLLPIVQRLTRLL